MKKIRVWIGADRFVIEECEGAAEIRRETAPKAEASDRAFFSEALEHDNTNAGFFFGEIRVELVE